MDALRRAMHTEGPMPGHIKISVARLATPENTSTPAGAKLTADQESTIQKEKQAPDQEPIKPAPLDVTESTAPNSMMESMRNPVLDRITRADSSSKKLR